MPLKAPSVSIGGMCRPPATFPDLAPAALAAEDPKAACSASKMRGFGWTWAHALDVCRRSAYFSLRQLSDPRVSTVEDSISALKPLRIRYLSVTTEPLPTIDTP